MSDQLVEVNLYPIPCIDIKNESDKKKLNEIIAKRIDYPHYLIQISEATLNKGIIPFYYINVEFSEPPYSQSNMQLIKYKVIYRMKDEVSGTVIIYGCPISK